MDKEQSSSSAHSPASLYENTAPAHPAQEEDDFEADADLPTYSSALSSALPVQYNVYRDGSGLLYRNEIVTGEDKEKSLYHYDVPTTLSGAWRSVLRRGGPQGPEVASFHKSHAFARQDFTVSWADARPDITCSREGHFNTPYLFRLGDKDNGELYAWLPDGLVMNKFNYTLHKYSDLSLPVEQRKALAHLRLPKMTYAWSKQSALTISPDLTRAQEAILATALGIGIRSRERRDWGW